MVALHVQLQVNYEMSSTSFGWSPHIQLQLKYRWNAFRHFNLLNLSTESSGLVYTHATLNVA